MHGGGGGEQEAARCLRRGQVERPHGRHCRGMAGGIMSTLTLPSPRLEEWRWADMGALRAAADAEPRDAGIKPADLFLDVEGPRLLFVDGVFEPAHSRPGPVKIARFAPET